MNKSLGIITGAFVVVMCLIMCGYFYFTPIFIDRVYGTRRTILISMLLGYAIFRGFRLYSAYIKMKQDEKKSNF